MQYKSVIGSNTLFVDLVVVGILMVNLGTIVGRKQFGRNLYSCFE